MRSNAIAEKKLPAGDAQTLAAVGIITLRMLEELLPESALDIQHKAERISMHFTRLVEYINSLQKPPEYVQTIIADLIMDMQFQDRNTQIMDNANALLSRYRLMLEEGSNCASANDAAYELLSVMRLSDIRLRYADAARAAGIVPGNAPAEHMPSDTIELF